MKVLRLSLVILTIGAAFLWHATDGLQALTSEGARRLAVEQNKPAVPSVVLQTMSEEFQRLRTNDNRVIVTEFIYTTCPFICQTDGSYLKRLRDRVVAEGLGDDVRILSISFDPERDTPEELRHYGRQHEADGKVWTIARPDIVDLPVFLETFGIRVIPDEYGGYEHNSAMHIINHKGQLAAIMDSTDIDGALTKVRKMVRQ